MRPSDSRYPADWLRIAEEDWQRVGNRLDLHDATDAGFHLQQAAEKFLKAFLLSKGWALRWIHELEALLDDAMVYDPSLDVYRAALVRATAFYFIDRYPFVLAAKPAEEEVRGVMKDLQPFVETLRRAVASGGAATS